MSDQAAGRRVRPGRVVLAVVLLVVVVAVVVRLASGGGDDGTAGDGGGAGGSAAAVPTPPASAPGRGSYVESTVAADGTVQVRQWIRSSTPIRQLELTTVDPSRGGATAEGVVVLGLDGSVLAREASVGGTTVKTDLATAVPNLYLHYSISGATDDATQTVQGRLLVNVLGMDVEYGGLSGTTVREVRGPGSVTSVACLRVDAAQSSPPKPCGAPTSGGAWVVSLRGIDRTDRLLAQLDTGS